MKFAGTNVKWPSKKHKSFKNCLATKPGRSPLNKLGVLRWCSSGSDCEWTRKNTCTQTDQKHMSHVHRQITHMCCRYHVKRIRAVLNCLRSQVVTGGHRWSQVVTGGLWLDPKMCLETQKWDRLQTCDWWILPNRLATQFYEFYVYVLLSAFIWFAVLSMTVWFRLFYWNVLGLRTIWADPQAGAQLIRTCAAVDLAKALEVHLLQNELAGHAQHLGLLSQESKAIADSAKATTFLDTLHARCSGHFGSQMKRRCSLQLVKTTCWGIHFVILHKLCEATLNATCMKRTYFQIRLEGMLWDWHHRSSYSLGLPLLLPFALPSS